MSTDWSLIDIFAPYGDPFDRSEKHVQDHGSFRQIPKTCPGSCALSTDPKNMSRIMGVIVTCLLSQTNPTMRFHRSHRPTRLRLVAFLSFVSRRARPWQS